MRQHPPTVWDQSAAETSGGTAGNAPQSQVQATADVSGSHAPADGAARVYGVGSRWATLHRICNVTKQLIVCSSCGISETAVSVALSMAPKLDNRAMQPSVVNGLNVVVRWPWLSKTTRANLCKLSNNVNSWTIQERRLPPIRGVAATGSFNVVLRRNNSLDKTRNILEIARVANSNVASIKKCCFNSLSCNVLFFIYFEMEQLLSILP